MFFKKIIFCLLSILIIIPFYHAKAGRISITPRTGITQLSYKQSNVRYLSETLVSFQLTSTYFFGRKWTSEIGINYTGIPIQSNTKNEMSLMLLDSDFKIAYEIYLSKTWFMKLNLGWYYMTSFPNHSTFGYSNVSGPQFYPTLAKTFQSQKKILMYFKFFPILKQKQFLTINNNYMGIGLEYYFSPFSDSDYGIFNLPSQARDTQIFGLTLNLGSLNFNYKSGNIRSSTLGLGISYSF